MNLTILSEMLGIEDFICRSQRSPAYPPGLPVVRAPAVSGWRVPTVRAGVLIGRHPTEVWGCRDMPEAVGNAVLARRIAFGEERPTPGLSLGSRRTC